jgi:hypothetical protein
MDYIDLIIKQLKKGSSKDSSEIQALLESLRQTSPELFEIAKRVIDNWEVVPTVQTSIIEKLSSPKVYGGGLGIATIASIPWLQSILRWLETNYPLTNSCFTSPISMFAIIATLGGISGAFYSIFLNRALVLPAFRKHNNALILSNLGIGNEVLYGLIASVVTIWFTAIGISPAGLPTIPSGLVPLVPSAATAYSDSDNAPTFVSHQSDGATKSTETIPSLSLNSGRPNLLTYSVIFGSLISGWYGARMRAFNLGQSLLQKVLADTSTTPPLTQDLADMIRKSRTAADAAAIAAQVLEVVGAAVSVPEAALKPSSPSVIGPTAAAPSSASITLTAASTAALNPMTEPPASTPPV